MTPSVHRWVRIPVADDYLRLGWVAESTLEGTTHGFWSVHMVWICADCQPIEPKRAEG